MQLRSILVYPFSCLLLFGLLTCTKTYAAQEAQELPNGVFISRQSEGTLVIDVNPEGKKIFGITLIRTNGNLCDLGGEVHGLSGQTEESLNEPVCRIDFQRVKRGISVSVRDGADCSSYCSSVPWLEGEYWIPPKGCSSEDRESRKENFLSLYRNRQYVSALNLLSEMYRQCEEFLNWIEVDSIRNDIAITQFHLGNKEACLAAMKNNVASAYHTEQSLKNRISALEFDNYLSVAEATWFNTKKCAGKTLAAKAAAPAPAVTCPPPAVPS